MKKSLTIISLLAVVYVGQPQITFNPFSISFETFYLMIPLFIVFGIWIFLKEKDFQTGILTGIKRLQKMQLKKLKE